MTPTTRDVKEVTGYRGLSPEWRDELDRAVDYALDGYDWEGWTEAEQGALRGDLLNNTGAVLFDALVAFAALRTRAEEAERLVKAMHDAGRAEVDKALAQFGYDSLRFADVRHGWLATTQPIRDEQGRALLTESFEPREAP